MANNEVDGEMQMQNETKTETTKHTRTAVEKANKTEQRTTIPAKNTAHDASPVHVHGTDRDPDREPYSWNST